MPEFYTDTCDRPGCDGMVTCIVQDVVRRRDAETGRRWTEPDGPTRGFCSEHARKARIRKETVGRAEHELPF